VPWHVAIARRHADFLDFYFVHEHFLRYATPVAGRVQPFWYFPAVLAVGMLPWTPLVVVGLVRLGALRTAVIRRARPELVFLAAWSLFIVVFFSLSKSKLSAYVLPALPPLAVLVGLLGADAGRESAPGFGRGLRAGAALLVVLDVVLLVIGLARVPQLPAIPRPLPVVLALAAISLVLALRSGWTARRQPAAERLFAAAVLFLAGLIAAAPPILANRTSTALAPPLAAGLAPADRLFSYKECPYDLAATLDREIDVVSYAGELEFGLSHLTAEERARRFPDLASFGRTWSSPTPAWLVVRERHLASLRAAGIELDRPLVGEGEYRLYRNRAAASR